MNINKSNRALKVFVIFVAIIFSSSLVCVDSSGQMPASPAGTTGTTIFEEEVGQPLPDPGNVTVDFKDVDIKTVLHYLSEVSGVDIVPSPGVEGNITMRLRNKPWEVALDIVTRNYGFVYSRDDEQDIIRVMPRDQLQTEESVTEVIPLNNLIREIELKREKAGEEVTVEEKEESIKQLMVAINSILDPRRGERATFIASVNSIVVTAIPARISEIKGMVAKVDKRTPQIILDAKVVEIMLTEDERFGIDWNTVITAAGARRPTTFPFTNTGGLQWLPGSQSKFYPTGTPGQSNAGFPPIDLATLVDPMAAATAGAIFSYGTLDFSTFRATLNLLEQRGDTEILSSPRITTLNNQKATIKVIDKIMFQKTQKTTETAVVGVVTVEFEDEEEAREVGVKLVVIPHVNEEGDISVNLLPEVSTNQGIEPLTVTATETTYSLTFSSREANTIIRVKDGETIFLGGLIRKNIMKTDNKFPILGDLFGGIPVLGNAFRYEAEDVERTEIVFFVTVYLVRDGMDSIRRSGTVEQYEEYFSQEERERAKSAAEEETGKTPVIRAGEIKVSEETVEINVAPTEAGKKAYKPFLDFRKKKQKAASEEAESPGG
jgi:type IV pilus assembly protein PilQ